MKWPRGGDTPEAMANPKEVDVGKVHETGAQGDLAHAVRTPKAPHPDRDAWRKLRRHCGQRYRAERDARAEIDRYEWKNIYRAMRCLRGRAMSWLRKAARVPRNQVSNEFWIARQLLMAKYAEPDTDWEQPWMSVEDWRPDNRSCLRLFTLVVPRNFPRPMPCDVIRWALGAPRVTSRELLKWGDGQYAIRRLFLLSQHEKN